MQAATLYSEVCMALMRIGTRMATGFDQHFAQAGLTQAQFRLLLAAWSEGGAEGASPSHLADYLLIERATVSVLSQNLVKRGWLSRHPGSDRRSYKLAVTAAGGRVLQNAVPTALALAEQTLEGLTPKQLQSVLQTLQLIEGRMRTLKEEREADK
ncbi:MAG: winged helix-turn-helix transcriptional regulator [Anaerolineales bacterium]|nr:winged helix-turn-helix transcriptional regulator [Anaerolineales bacterium]QYK51503.1 MAG: winged helix-turn-helix transcriptional regulator [Anaerolineales bacterium]